MIEANICIDEDAEKIYKAILPEMEKHLRSTIDIKCQDNKLNFDIKASDITALRASLNSIIQMLTVFMKVKIIK